MRGDEREAVLNRVRHRLVHGFVELLADLPALFANMNGIDFDGNGAPDVAYGSAYIGLTYDGMTAR